MSDLVGNPEDRFSRVAAHILPDTLGLFCAEFPSVLLLGELKQLPTSDAVSVLSLLGPRKLKGTYTVINHLTKNKNKLIMYYYLLIDKDKNSHFPL